MVTLIIPAEDIELHCCCEPCARLVAETWFPGEWWEIVSFDGELVASVENPVKVRIAE